MFRQSYGASLTFLTILLWRYVQAGTYVKEFCHGDESRTKPSLTSLLECNEAIRVLELDVTEIHMEFP